MATVGETSRPAYGYDSATDTWIPIGIGPHSHTPAAIGAVSSSVVTAKGDLIVGTSSGVVSNKSVGADGSYLVADSTQTTGVNWAGPSTMAGKNAVINGGFDIWQRGTSNTYTVGPFYTADRFTFNCSAVTSVTISQITTSDTTNLPNIYNAMRVQRTAGNSSTPLVLIQNALESKDSYRFAGKNVTFSFWARKGANFSPSAFTAQLISGTGTDQSLVSGFTNSNGVISESPTLTTTWQRFTYTGTVPSSATQLGFQFFVTYAGTAGAADSFDITGVQLELGSVATPFARAGGTIQGELAACQRYYYRVGGNSAYQSFGLGSAKSTTVVAFPVPNPVTMRVNPTAVEYSTLICFDGNGFTSAVSAVTLDGPTTNNPRVNVTVTGATQFRPYELLTNNSTSGYIGISAEL